ncbi:MAG TPA: DNA alkylation repair protein [Candidatus Paceibacterota bacterium]|nr:DNA alkylation repair protein [Candidatus Paceibacterota bacterium]
MLKQLRKELALKANPKKAKILQGFFKTGKGEYGEGDIFLGLVVPETRKMAEKYSALNLVELKKLLNSKIHEERLLALFILTAQFSRAEEKGRQKLFKFYLSQTRNINNWDLVDLSADKIVGSHLKNKDKKILYQLAKSRNLWERRIAILATFHFIKQGQAKETLKISEILLNDKHDLIQKAVGWMLREVGKRCGEKTEEKFLKQHCRKMPRTMLRYAIERFPENKRKKYLQAG